MGEVVGYEVRGHVGVITLDRPQARNAIDTEMASAIESAVDRVEDDDEVRVGVLCANTDGQTSPVFCAGADLKAMRSGITAAEARVSVISTSAVTRRGGFAGIVDRKRRKPLVVAVDGLATAGGCEIVLSCDIVVATNRSAFGLAEVKYNLMAAAGGLYKLPRTIGRSTAMLAILTGEPLSARRAYELGLVAELVRPGDAEAAALRIAEKIAACAPLAVYASRRVTAAAHDLDDRELTALTDELRREVFAAEDTEEGLAAFAERRTPIWKGR